MCINKMSLSFKSLSENEAFARSSVAGFCLPLNPTIDEIVEIKTAVSEAITNCIVHAYPDTIGTIRVDVTLNIDTIYISVRDYGIGIKYIKQAVTPFYTSKPDEERTGMGFTVMESFMDNVKVKNNKNRGITVLMSKKIKGALKESAVL